MLVYGKCECFGMQMLYVCVLCVSCCRSQFCMTCSLLMLVEDARGDHICDPSVRLDAPSICFVFLYVRSYLLI